MLILHLKPLHIDLLKQEAENAQLIEACAMLFGKLSHIDAVVEKIQFAPNKLHSQVKFEIDPERVVAAFTEKTRIR